MFRPLLLILSLFIVLIACKTPLNLSEIDWVLGNWQVNESTAFEEWRIANDTLYRGKGYKIRKNDTLVTETIEIVKKGESIYFIPSVLDQNDGKPVEFKLISKKRKELVFENLEHDFPQRIIYVKTSENEIDARIEGMKQGFFSEVKFKLKKVN